MAEIVLTEPNAAFELTSPDGPIEVEQSSAEFVIETTGVIGSALPPTTGNDGFALIEVGGEAAFRPILASYVVPAFDVQAFTPGVSTAEVGQTVTTPAFTAAYNRTPDTATLTDNQGNPPKDVSTTPTAFASNHSFTKSGNNETVGFGLAATSGAESDSASASIAWRPRAFWGDGVDGLSTEADIEALANSALAASRARTFTVTAGPGRHIYYAFPTSYGDATFFVGGFEGGFQLVSSSIAVTNAFGVAQNYRLYKSTNANLGTTTVVVQ